jgi:TonB family protein
MLTEIVNHLWQSTLVLAAIAALAALLRDHGAHARYWLWWAASVKFLVPFSLLTALGDALGTRAVLIEPDDWTATLGLIAQPMPATAASTLPLALLGLWGIGFAAVAGAWLVRALKLRALLVASVPHAPDLPRLAGAIEARTTTTLVEPALIGIVRPVLLLPRGIAERLSAVQLDAVVAHELAHWRRRDNLTAAVHMLVEAVFWFHPLVWWLGARLVEERERACDEAVLGAGHDGRAYAEGILNVCEHYVASSLKCAAGVSGADLKRRVVEITRNRVMSELPLQKKILLGAFALSMVIAPVMFGIVDGRAMAQDTSDIVPLVRINPDYPPDALAARVEGSVILEFTVTTTGTIKDAVVVESSSPVFDAAALAALGRWRYQPKMENGQPVERRGVRTIIRFQLGDRTL